jgi:hypothetical protein
MDDMPDPREGDEVAWENVYCGRPDDDTAELELELRRIEATFTQYYGGYAPTNADEREEVAEMQARIVEITEILSRREIVAGRLA